MEDPSPDELSDSTSLGIGGSVVGNVLLEVLTGGPQISDPCI